LKVTFYGAADEVGRSCILVANKDTKLLLDAGVKLAEKVEMPLIPKEILNEISAVIVSHAHLDHNGYLPHLFSAGFESNIYATKPTLELTNVIVSDYLRISKPSEVTKEGIAKMVKHYKQVEYHKEFKVGSFAVKLYPAGHILGSAMIEVKDTNTGDTLLYTGDVNLRSTKLLPPAYTERLQAKTLITESTYGGDNDVFESEKVVINGFITSIKETLNTGNKIIIPSFAVGRAQEVLFILNNYMRSGKLPEMPIYIDGMISKAMRIYRHNVIYCRDEIQKQILMSDDDPFKSKYFHYVKGKSERSKVINSKESSVIVTTSGMLKGGPVAKYLEKLASNENNKLVFVGYQALGTPGRKILEGERKIQLNGKDIEIKMKVERYRLSAHADRQDLLKLMGKVNGLRSVVVIHGEPEKIKELALSIRDKYKVYAPSLTETIEV